MVTAPLAVAMKFFAMDGRYKIEVKSAKRGL
jgi:hypothetical protein